MSHPHDRPHSWGDAIYWFVKAVVATIIAAVLWVLATLIALMLIFVLAAVWYLFFGAPVLGDFLGLLGGETNAAMPLTRDTMILAGIMTLLVVGLCALVVWIWIQWQRTIFLKRRAWLS